MIQWFEFGMITSEWERYPKDGCQGCSQLTINTIVEQTRRRIWCGITTRIWSDSDRGRNMDSPTLQRKPSNNRTSGFLRVNRYWRRPKWGLSVTKLWWQFFGHTRSIIHIDWILKRTTIFCRLIGLVRLRFVVKTTSSGKGERALPPKKYNSVDSRCNYGEIYWTSSFFEDLNYSNYLEVVKKFKTETNCMRLKRAYFEK